MRKTLFFLVLLPLCARTQNNLVPNPSFEEYKQLPCECMQGNMSDYLKDWDAANDGTSDYITDLAKPGCYANSKSPGSQGPQVAHTGHAMAFFYNQFVDHDNYREYVAVTLKSPLEVGKKYYAEMFVSLSDNSTMASNNVGICFFEGELHHSDGYQIYSTPQINATNIITDAKGWTKVSGTFIADKPYTYLVIGNFMSKETTLTQKVIPQGTNDMGGEPFAGFYVDDVNVDESTSNLRVEGDTLVAPNSMAYLTAKGSKTYAWADAARPKVILGREAELKVQMKTKRTFIVYGDHNESLTITVNVTSAPVFLQTLNGRKVKKGSTIKIHNEKIKVTVYDNNKIDGDSISLYYGDSCIVSHCKLTNKKKTFTITIDKNHPKQLILFAENLGSMPPNTAALVIGDGKENLNVVLSSDLKSSDSVMLCYENDH